MKNAFEYEAELAALREELAELQDDTDKHISAIERERIDAEQRLADAEQRNADMLNWLRRNANAEKDPVVRASFIEAHNALKQISRPTGSGASE